MELANIMDRAVAIQVLLTMMVFFVVSCQARAESLNEAWSIALAVDNRGDASRYLTEAARWQHTAARRAYSPKLTNVTSYNVLTDSPALKTSIPGIPLPAFAVPVAQDEFAVSSTMVTMPLYTGGKIKYAAQAAISQISAEENGEAETVLDIKMDVVSAYTTVLRLQQAVLVAEANVKSLDDHTRVVGNLLREGLVARNDLLAVQVTLADARQRALQARNGLEIARAAYNRLLGRPQTDPVQLEEIQVDPTEEDLEHLIASAIGTRPELARLAAQANALRCQAQSMRATTKPNLGVSGGFTYVENRYLVPEGYGSLAIGLEWTPYDGGMSRAKSNSLLQQANALARLRADATTRVTLQVRQTWLDVQETQQRIEVTGRAIDQAEENVRVAAARYEKGQGTNTEVLDAETLRTLSHSNYFNAVYDSALAVFRLRRAVGTL